jgi:hypothetical protein
MRYRDFDLATREPSDRLADLLRTAGIRFKQRPLNDPTRPSVYSLRVHPDDLDRANEIRAEAVRQSQEAFVRMLHFVRRTYCGQDTLVSREPNEAGYYVSVVYHGESFDPARYRVVRGGWDHEHCHLCWAKVLPGDEWWATRPANFEDEIGLCLDCHSKLFG